MCLGGRQMILTPNYSQNSSQPRSVSFGTPAIGEKPITHGRGNEMFHPLWDIPDSLLATLSRDSSASVGCRH